jgi:rhomboid family GlyGly-CTERM serine protease
MNAVPYLTLSTATLAVATWHPPGLASLLEWSRTEVGNGSWWRLLTGHFCHFSFQHLLWDLALFLALGTWVERQSRRAWLAVIGGSALAISVALWFGAPEIQTYRGLSGIDSALFAWIAFDVARFGWKARRWSALWLGGGALAGLLGKATYEAISNALLFVDPAGHFVPVPLAHVAGGLAGVAVCFASRLKRISPAPTGLNPLRRGAA